jgi:hypothetical protein
MHRSIAVISVVLLLTACSSSKPAPGPEQGQVLEAKPQVLKAAAARAAAEAAAAGGEDEGDHTGCIYAEGQEGTPEDPACPHGHGEPDAPAGGDGHFGEAFALGDAVPLGQAVESPGDAPVQVRGEVEAVCQKKGCWMVIKDGAISARVLMKGHGFAVPMDSRGKVALVEGTLSSRTFDEDQVKHLEKDAGRDPSKVSGQRTEHVLTATGIEIKS